MASHIKTVSSEGQEWLAEQRVLRLQPADYDAWIASVSRKAFFIKIQESVFIFSIILCVGFFLFEIERTVPSGLLVVGLFLLNIATFMTVLNKLWQEELVRKEIFNRNFSDLSEEDWNVTWLNAATEQEMGKYGQRRYLILPNE